MFENFLMRAITSLPGIIIAMVVHEWAHARVAYALGDFTPKMQGRLTLNPMAHIDPFGLIFLLVAHFGWAKPVQINPYNFSNPKRDDILVSLAGPASNFLVAFLTLLVLIFMVKFGVPMSDGMKLVLNFIMVINVNFGIFNLLPIPPLDGSHILKQILPYELAQRYEFIERYSMFIFLLIIMTPILDWVFVPLQRFVLGIFQIVAGILL